MTDRELRPVGRFEWEQIILRARLGGLIQGNGRGTRGGVSASAFKAVALVWASHADPDGTNIWPGDATLAVEAEVGLKVAQAVKRKMVELGLTERVKARSRRQHRGDEYRLTLPSDLLDVVEVLTPAAVKVAAIDTYEKARGKRGGSSGPLSIGPVRGPEDPPQNDVQGPMDPPQDEKTEIRGGSDGTANPGCGGSDGTSVGGPPDRDTTQTSHLSTTQTREEVRTAVTGPRAREAEDPIPDERQHDKPHPDLSPRRCTPHGLAAGTRPDGRPACPLCRVEQDQAAGRRRTSLAPVISLRSA